MSIIVDFQKSQTDIEIAIQQAESIINIIFKSITIKWLI